MKWSDFVSSVAVRCDVPRGTVHRVLSAMTEELSERLREGDSVSLRGIGTLSRRWLRGRTVRSIDSGRKMWVGGRHGVRFAVSSTLKRELQRGGDQGWRSPEHQAAWRLAETLIGDLELYQASAVPAGIHENMDLEEVRGLCAASLGDDWQRACDMWRGRVSKELVHGDLLASAARRRWAT